MSIAGDDPTPWNLLHGGTVRRVERVEDTIVVTVDLAEARARAGGDGMIRLRLAGCDGISYQPHDEPVLYELTAIASSEPDLDAARAEAGALVVAGRAGVLRLQYANLAIELPDGTPLTLDELAAAVHREAEPGRGRPS